MTAKRGSTPVESPSTQENLISMGAVLTRKSVTLARLTKIHRDKTKYTRKGKNNGIRSIRSRRQD